MITPHLDRQFATLSPVERAILYIGAYELAAHPKTPFKVVLNEAIELGKSFGGTDGHRFVNGVLEKIAVALRPEEVARDARTNALNEFEIIRRYFDRPAEACAGRRSATTARCCGPTPASSSRSPPTCWSRAGISCPAPTRARSATRRWR